MRCCIDTPQGSTQYASVHKLTSFHLDTSALAKCQACMCRVNELGNRHWKWNELPALSSGWPTKKCRSSQLSEISESITRCALPGRFAPFTEAGMHSFRKWSDVYM